jgi:hypothetical protein
MENKFSGKIRLVFSMTICLLFIGIASCSAVVKADADWDFTTNSPHMFALPSGNIGIGVTSPLAKFHVKGGAVLFSGGTGGTPTSGAGRRLMWVPSKAAFRVGRVLGNQWNNANIGLYSVAMGDSTTASGDCSIAMGVATIASGWSSTAMGEESKAIGKSAVAMGEYTTANGDYSTAMGDRTSANGIDSTAMGVLTTASGDYSTAMGYSTTANGIDSTAMGVLTTASGIYSTAMGWWTSAIAKGSTAMGCHTNAYGDYSTAMGLYTAAGGSASTAMGSYTSANGLCSTTMGILTVANGMCSTALGQTMIVNGNYSLGIGLDYRDWAPYSVTQNNVMSIMGGNVGIGTTTPEGTLHVNGTIKLDPITAPGTPTIGFVIYCDSSDGKLKAKSSSGTVTVLANP